MPAPATPPVQYLVVGASHRSSALSLRGRLMVEETAMPRFLAQLQVRGVPEAVVLSTPERIEVIAAAEDTAAATESIRRALADQAGLNPTELKGQIHAFKDVEAVRYLFAAAAGLDALVPGDPEVAARLRAAVEQARQGRTLGPAVELLVEAALSAAAQVAEATGLAARPAAMAAAAVKIARDVHGDLSKAQVLVIGPGDMGERLAENLIAAGVTRLVLTGRSATQLEKAARRLRCEVVPLDSLDAALAAADIVVANMGSHPPVITAPMVRAALKKRRQKPIFLVDAAIPGDIERAAGEEEEAFRYDLGDLERVVSESDEERERAAVAAADIVANEAEAFLADSGGAGSADELTLLRRRFETARAATLEETSDAATATRLLVDRLLPQVAALVREAARRAGGPPRGGVPPRPVGKKE